MVLRYFLKAY